MLREIPNKEVNKLWEILNAEDQDQITKDEATDLGFTYLIEQGFRPTNENSSLPEIYLNMVSENMDTLQWNRCTKEQLTELVALASGKETIELDDIDESGLVCDYAFLCGIFENYGYIDLYYLIPPIDSEVLLVTGMTISAE